MKHLYCKSMYEISFGWGVIPMNMIRLRPLTFILAVATSCFSHKNAIKFVEQKLEVDNKTARVLLLNHAWGAGEQMQHQAFKNLTSKEFKYNVETVTEVWALAFKEEE